MRRKEESRQRKAGKQEKPEVLNLHDWTVVSFTETGRTPNRLCGGRYPEFTLTVAEFEISLRCPGRYVR